jgi:hypothetical protein
MNVPGDVPQRQVTMLSRWPERIERGSDMPFRRAMAVIVVL